MKRYRVDLFYRLLIIILIGCSIFFTIRVLSKKKNTNPPKDTHINSTSGAFEKTIGDDSPFSQKKYPNRLKRC